ncbi:DUF922 domain-containing protein [Neolewinella antarctica]|uniref:DUF922 domain-containing protein n=1 Tax=Neolewinella antarctica TaxID=442734 RepID=A0ABX0XDL4_9BACT|nr:hypothetical protein [Neolewinella antarctica]NJC27021.1 hypothetical protein [Neolewinella antarctica]
MPFRHPLTILTYLLLTTLTQTCQSPAPTLSLQNQRPAQPPTAPFGLIDQTERPAALPADALLIGEIEIKEKGFTINCDYASVRKAAETEARRAGANLLEITEHRLPDYASTCHRIRGRLYLVAEPEAYEDRVYWSAERRLGYRNFRGDTLERPFQAATSTNITYALSAVTRFGKYRLRVQSYFDPRLSYFKHGRQDSTVLVHEQVHFDITELYARKFRRYASETTFNRPTVQAELERHFASLIPDWQREQDRYDSQVYANRSLQPGWTIGIAAQLDSLVDYAEPEVILRINK